MRRRAGRSGLWAPLLGLGQHIRLVSSILHGGWEALDYKNSGKAVSY
ncbi:MAG: hypothetical protein ACLUEK_05635 [Oscillospiraceae bacterium]